MSAETPAPTAERGRTSAAGTADRILDAAEHRVRQSGYNGFSFRDLADDVGIRSASVHHHFPTKEALIERLIARYTDGFLSGIPEDARGLDRIEAYRTAFRTSLSSELRMCLCGVLGAEAAGLPASVKEGTRRFFERVVDDLRRGLEGTVADPEGAAVSVVAQLEGASILARGTGTLALFDQATATVTACATATPSER